MTYESKTFEEIFANEISKISDSSAKEIVSKVFAHVNEAHKTEPASATGKYHPLCSTGNGGLVRHTKFVVQVLVDFLRATPSLEYESDLLIAAAILHDMMKYPDGADSKTNFGHPTDMANLIRRTCPNDEKADTIARLVESHQGIWTTARYAPGKFNRAPEKFDEYVLHYADYVASRPYLNVFFDESGEMILDTDKRDAIIAERSNNDKSK